MTMRNRLDDAVHRHSLMTDLVCLTLFVALAVASIGLALVLSFLPATAGAYCVETALHAR